MVSTHPAVLAAPRHYRHLERAKITALRHSHNYNTVVTTSDNMRQDLTWWLQELPRHNGRSMQIMQWDMVIESDASMLGWGASLNNTSTGGPWAPQERSHHINYLELLAAFLALKTLHTQQGNSPEIRQCDSHCLSQQNGGTHSETLCNLAVHNRKWCLERNIFIHAEHLPGKLNVRADWHSRHTQEDCSDWQLHPLIFQQLQDKINREKVEAVVIAPVWCNQVWYPLLLWSLQDAPILFPNTMDIILNPQGEPHPLVQQGHLPLAAWPASGRVMAQKPKRPFRQSGVNHGDVMENVNGTSVSSVAQGSLARDGPLSDPESHGSVSSVAQGSLARDGPLSDPESHGSVSSVAQCSLARDGPLSDRESHGSVSSVVQCSFARDGPLSDPESHGSVSCTCCAMLICSRRASLWSGVSWVSLICCARLICWRRLVLWSGVSDSNRPLL